MKPNKHVMMALLVMLLLVATTLAILTATMTTSESAIMRVLIHNHVPLMLVLIFIAIGFGFFWASSLQGELRREQRESQKLLSLISDLLHPDEQLVLRLLVEAGGKLSQSELSRHERLTRVKAHRIVRALSERGVVHAEKRGKAVILYLDEPLLGRLSKR